MKYEVKESEDWLVEEDRQDLRNRTKCFALRVIQLYGILPKSTLAQTLGKQVLRLGTSVRANYREAWRARSKPDVERQLGDGGTTAAEAQRREHFRVHSGRKCEQTTYWFELLIETDTTPGKQLANLTDEADQLLAIFTTISKKVKARKK
ncbi:MAG: four helix bundle protein [Verrucomicrobia bacterium]|jgi:hypothetical protein|nr:four helix bundle protein [Verrucomicrobiota bacterium]